MIFTAAADDDLEPIVESAFENVEQGGNFISIISIEITVAVLFFVSKSHLTLSNGAVVLEHFDQVVGDCFMDCVNCLIGFANNKTSHRISLKAIALLRICEDRLAEVHHTIYIFGHESPFFLPFGLIDNILLLISFLVPGPYTGRCSETH